MTADSDLFDSVASELMCDPQYVEGALEQLIEWHMRRVHGVVCLRCGATDQTAEGVARQHSYWKLVGRFSVKGPGRRGFIQYVRRFLEREAKVREELMDRSGWEP